MPFVSGEESPTEAARDTALSGHVLYELAEAIETVTDNRITVVLQFQMALFTGALVLFVLGYIFLGEHLLIAGILSCLPIGYGISILAFDKWLIIALILWLVGCTLAEGRRVVS